MVRDASDLSGESSIHLVNEAWAGPLWRDPPGFRAHGPPNARARLTAS